MTIAQRFEQVAGRRSTHPAIVFNGRVTTYAQLADRAEQVASRLAASGIRPGETVALFFDRGADGLAAMLGAWTVGAIAVPLVPSHPFDRLRRMLNDARPRALLTDTAHHERATGLDDRQLAIIDIDLPVTRVSFTRPAFTADGPALVLYTSGSAGAPKGVLHTHATSLHKIDRVTRRLQITENDRIGWFSTYAVGQGISASWIALLAGATLCPFDVRGEGVDRLYQWIEQQRISIYLSSATLFRNIAAEMNQPATCSSVRMIRIGGERVRPADVDAQRRLFPAAQLVVSYSATETGPISAHFVGADETFTDGLVPVGRPFDDLDVFIADPEGNEVANGDEGEICVRSAYLFAGYANETPSPAALSADARPVRTYRTGDLGRVRADGLLEHRGRKDLRVKIRGFRIEIEEVEAMLEQNPAVARAAVAAKPDANGELRLVAYIEPVARTALNVETLRADLATRIPEHMLPSTFVWLDAMPVTDSGKVARQQLPEPTSDRPELAASFVAPRTAIEETIARVWQDVLGLDAIGVHDDFLALGGDSLKATQVASRLNAALQIEIPLHIFFEAATVADIAARMPSPLTSDL